MISGNTTLTSRDALARKKLLAILAGSWIAQGIYAVAKLGVADLLAGRAAPVAWLADQCQADPEALRRLLRALTRAGVFTQPEPDTFGLSSVGELLRTDVSGSVHLNAIMQGEEIFRSFAEIMHTMRTGRPAFEMVFGKPFYDYLAEHPQAAHTFHESMAGQSTPSTILDHDLGDASVIVDVGGGNGTLLVDLLRIRPGTRAVLVELPEAVREARQNVAAAGLGERVSLVEQSFFEPLPAGGDIYVLSRVLHNWPDEQAVQLLRRVLEAMSPGARLLIHEELLAEPDDPAGAGATNGRTGGLVDLLMLVTLEGRDRSESQYRLLLAQAGFDPAATTTVADGLLETRR